MRENLGVAHRLPIMEEISTIRQHHPIPIHPHIQLVVSAVGQVYAQVVMGLEVNGKIQDIILIPEINHGLVVPHVMEISDALTAMVRENNNIAYRDGFPAMRICLLI